MAAKRVDRLLEKATSPSLLEPDWETTFLFVDSVRSAEIPVKMALSSVKKRYHNENPHVSFYALCVLESLVKNCGDKVAKEVATKEYMEDLKHMAADAPAEKVKNKVLELIACWARVFQKKQEFKIVQDTYNLMKMEGFEFPSVSESQAMFDAESAPEWKDATVCSRCNTGFSLIIRKHHCRNCGDIYCDKCSSKSKPLPHLGIDREVRVCEGCFDKLNQSSKTESKSKTQAVSDINSIKLTKPGQTSKNDDADRKVKEDKAKEEEELQLALAISQSQAEEEERQKQRNMLNLYNGPDDHSNSVGFGYKGVKEEPKQATGQNVNGVSQNEPLELPVDNPELARYLNRGYWEQKKTEQKQSILRQSPTPSAPPPSTPSPMPSNESQNTTLVTNNALNANEQIIGEVTAQGDTPQFCEQLKKQMEIFVNRIKSNQARGRSVVMDSSIQSHFVALTNLHSQVLHRMHDLDERRAQQESLQDRLSHIGDARQAVDSLREEHDRQRQQMQAEAQRHKQMQMQAKLGLMRHKKHDMLEQQRTMAIQRMQQHEHEMAVRRHMQAQASMNPSMAYVPQPQLQYDPNIPQQQYMYQPPPGYAAPPPYDMQQMQHAMPHQPVQGYPPAPMYQQGYPPQTQYVPQPAQIEHQQPPPPAPQQPQIEYQPQPNVQQNVYQPVQNPPQAVNDNLLISFD